MGIPITGKLANEPREFKSKNGSTGISFSIPLKVYDDEQGKNVTEWIEVVQWFDAERQKALETMRHMLGKGAVVTAYGDLARRYYTNKDNERVSQLYVRFPKVDVISSAPREMDVTQPPRDQKPDVYDNDIPF